MNDTRTPDEKLRAELRAIVAEAPHHPNPGEQVARLAAAILAWTEGVSVETLDALDPALTGGEDDTIGTD